MTLLWRDVKKYRESWDKAIGEELDFSLRLKHYVDDTANVRDRRRIQPKGRELYGKLRHKSAQIVKEMHLDVRPVDQVTDPQSADMAKWVLQSELENPIKDYKTIREGVVLGALAARVWCAALDWHPEIGAFGEIVPRILDPRSLYWTPGWSSPHDLTCPWVIEVKTMRVADIRAMGKFGGWKNTSQVHADSGERKVRSQAGDPSLPPGQTRLPADTGNPTGGETDIEARATVLLCWFRDYENTRTQPAGEARILPQGDRYMACVSCGYTEKGAGPVADLPEVGGPCPTCGNPLQRIDAEVPTEEVLTYPKGRLVICAPFSDVTLYDDKWPYQIRTVPYLVVKAYGHPVELFGQSDTSLDWSLQLISNAMLRLGYEQMAENRDIIIAPEDGLLDASGEPWQFGDAQGRVAYWQGPGPPNVQHFQGSGLPPAWSTFFGSVQNVLMRDMGTSDIVVGPQETKNIPVGTVQAMEQQGEIPVEHHKQKLWQAESIFFGVWLDMIRELWTEKRLVRMLGPQGQVIFQSLRGMDLPNADVTVSAAPAIDNIDPAEVNALLAVLNAPPPMRKLLARKYNIPAQDMQQFEQDEMEWMQKQQSMMGAPPMGGGPGGPMPAGGPGAGPGQGPPPTDPAMDPLTGMNPLNA